MRLLSRRDGLGPPPPGFLPVAIAALGLLTGGAARSAVLETSTINTTYIYAFDGGFGDVITAGDNEHLRIDHESNGSVSEFGLDIDATLNNGNFDYLHNVYCVGNCRVSAITEIVFKLTNDSSEAAQVRFDSLITPGHVAALGLDTPSALQADYYLRVYKNGSAEASDYDPQATDYDPHATLLYNTEGLIAGYNKTGTLTGGALNGLQPSGDGTSWQVYDWSATNLNLAIDLAGNETTYVHYLSSINAESSADCTDLSDCAGAQAAFGDPRNNGGVVENAIAPFRGVSAFDTSDASDASDDSLEPVIGRAFDAYSVTAQLALPNDPLPKIPPVLPLAAYGAPFESQAVPEPSSWAMLIAGFLMVGAAMRRRGKSLPAARLG